MGSIKNKNDIMRSAVGGAGAATYLHDRKTLVRWELMGLVYVWKRFSDFDVYKATEAGRAAFGRGKLP
jgi:hypothetical protein